MPSQLRVTKGPLDSGAAKNTKLLSQNPSTAQYLTLLPPRRVMPIAFLTSFQLCIVELKFWVTVIIQSLGIPYTQPTHIR